LFIRASQAPQYGFALADVRESLEGGERDMKTVTGKKPTAHGAAADWNIGQGRGFPPGPDRLIGEQEPLAFSGFESLLSCWQAIDGWARLIISRDGRLIANSEGASRLFDQNHSPARTDSLIFACISMSDGQLKKLLGAKAGVVDTIVLPKKSGDGHYIVSVVGISAAAVAIAIREADGNFVTVFANLEDVFGLTPCEVLVIERLMRGFCAQRIADDLDVSVHTVRAHLRHCYDKLGVSYREALWQRLAPYRLN
jgi:DNA-binding CsgD family transcriptional regulator